MALQFPADKNQTNYEAMITFQALKLQAIDVSNIFRGFIKPTENANPTPDSVRADIQNKQAFEKTLTQMSEMNGGAKGTESIRGTGQKIEQRLRTAKLYLPQAIQIVDGAAYDNIDLGLLGASTEKGLQEGESLTNAVVKGAVSGVTSIIDAFKGGSAMASAAGRLAVSRAGGFIPNEGARGAVRSGTRTTLNPNTRALFKSVPLREFTFTFKMIPTSKEETQNIKDIIKFFRSELYPEIIQIGESGIAAGYEFPNVFEIKMAYKDKQLATKILPSYLRNFSATYNSSGMGFLEGGDFTEVDISMTFVESSTLHKKLITAAGEEGGY